MKQILRTYILTLLFIFIPFILLAFIFTLLSYFIQWNGLSFSITMMIISYLILMISGLFFTSQISEKKLYHCIIFAMIYFLISLIIHIGHINILQLILKPMIFIIIGFIKAISGANRKNRTFV